MDYSCAHCQEPVGPDEAFLRSVNLRTIAWCRTCWLDRRADLGLPAQRQAPVQERIAAPRRWLLFR